MSRRAIIVVLTVGAVAAAALWTASWCLAGYGFSGAKLGSYNYDVVLKRGEIYARCDYAVSKSTRNSQFRVLGLWVEWVEGTHVQVHGTLPPSVLVANSYVRGSLPLWMPFVFFAAYPGLAFIRGPLRLRFSRLIESDVFACSTGMLTWVVATALLLHLFSGPGTWLERWLGSDLLATAVVLATLVLVPATSAIVMHNVIVGPLRRGRRRRRGLCIKCGYDLTGNVTGTCSECGCES